MTNLFLIFNLNLIIKYNLSVINLYITNRCLMPYCRHIQGSVSSATERIQGIRLMLFSPPGKKVVS